MTDPKSNISPDGNWSITLENNQVKWHSLTKVHSNSTINDLEMQKKINGSYTMDEIIASTKSILPEIWEK